MMYHYTECGLDNVWLENGYKVHKTPYGKGVSIDDASGLHAVLVAELVKKQGRITGNFSKQSCKVPGSNRAVCKPVGAHGQGPSHQRCAGPHAGNRARQRQCEGDRHP